MYLHSGSTMLNLALTGKVFEGWRMGRMSNIIGDKSTGKTLLAMEAAHLALTSPDPSFPRGIDVYYHETEAAFDKAYAATLGLDVERVKFIKEKRIEGVYEQLSNICLNRNVGKGVLYIIDSWDSLTSEAEEKTDFDEGSYGMNKQKKGSEMFRRLMTGLENSNVHLMIISQVRSNINAGNYGPKLTRSGGRALDFYASHALWLQETQKIKRKDMVRGIMIKGVVKKNKVGPPQREAKFPIIFGYGVDDIFSMVEWLTSDQVPSEYRLTKSAGRIKHDGKSLLLTDFVIAVENDPELYVSLVNQAQNGWIALEKSLIDDRVDKGELIKKARELAKQAAKRDVAGSELKVEAG